MFHDIISSNYSEVYTMNFCNNCGTQLRNNDNFCAKCGAQVTPKKCPATLQIPIHIIIEYDIKRQKMFKKHLLKAIFRSPAFIIVIISFVFLAFHFWVFIEHLFFPSDRSSMLISIIPILNLAVIFSVIIWSSIGERPSILAETHLLYGCDVHKFAQMYRNNYICENAKRNLSINSLMFLYDGKFKACIETSKRLLPIATKYSEKYSAYTNLVYSYFFTNRFNLCREHIDFAKQFELSKPNIKEFLFMEKYIDGKYEEAYKILENETTLNAPPKTLKITNLQELRICCFLYLASQKLNDEQAAAKYANRILILDNKTFISKNIRAHITVT